jgi:hypothetical protein
MPAAALQPSRKQETIPTASNRPRPSIEGVVGFEHMFDDLNPEQRAAVVFGDGPLLIVAGAGTGKTTTLASRVGHLVERGVRPERILLLTFSRRAAREMLSRAERVSGHRDTSHVWGGTFHAVANRLIRLHGRPLGLRPDFTVLDQADAADVMNLLREELGFAIRGSGSREGHARVDLLADGERRGETGRRPRRHYPWCIDESDGIRQVFRRTPAASAAERSDYDDLLLFWKALATSPQTGEQLASMFDHVLVDEYQDTNALQADILEGMRPADTARNITVVGDDAQSIYGFRAATVRNILEFPTRFDGATVIRLEQNYRSITPILSATNAAIALSPQRHEKTLWSAREGAYAGTRTCLTKRSSATSCAGACVRIAKRAWRSSSEPCCSARPSLGSSRGGAGSQHPVREVRRVEVPEAAHEGRAVAASGVGEPFDEVSGSASPAAGRGGPAIARRLMDGPASDADDDQPSPLLRFLRSRSACPRQRWRRAGAARSVGRLFGGRASCRRRAARSPPRVPRAGLRAPVRRGGIAHT